jgi:hypothetical protein
VPVLVVGDVVDSRREPDQRRLLDGVAAAVATLPSARSAAATTGDEFQAVYDHLPDAIVAVARLRLRLLDEPPAAAPVEVRVGFGVGSITAGTDAGAGAPGQSGPGWWSARTALDHVSVRRRAWPPLRWWVVGEGELAPVRATLVALDSLLDRFDATDVSLARGLLVGASASDLAEAHGITRQSVARRLHDHGVYGWVRTLQTLSEEAP